MVQKAALAVNSNNIEVLLDSVIVESIENRMC